MKTILILLTLLAAQDDKKAERDRMELLKRVAPALGTLGEKRDATTHVFDTPIASALWTSATQDYSEALRIQPTQNLALSLLSHSRGLSTSSSGAPLPGFFIDDKGLFLTTAEALEGSPDKVTLPDGRTFRGRLVSKSTEVGLALLQLETGAATKALRLADSGGIEPGRTAVIATFADTSPVLRHAMVIGRDRDAMKSYSVEDFLHIDYPALPAELGSAVLDLDGTVIGILARTAFETGGGATVPRRAYAIPSSTIKAMLAKRNADGDVEIGILGVQLNGNVITEVVKDSAAEKAGLQVGDAIQSVEGHPVKDVVDLGRRTRFKAREKVTLSILRKEATLKIDATLGVHVTEGPKRDPGEAAMDRAGLEVSELTAALRDYLDLPEMKGLVVQRVHAGRPAAIAGIRKGDVITTLDNAPVESAKEMQETLAKLKSDYFVLDTWRDGKKVPVVVKLK